MLNCYCYVQFKFSFFSSNMIFNVFNELFMMVLNILCVRDKSFNERFGGVEHTYTIRVDYSWKNVGFI